MLIKNFTNQAKHDSIQNRGQFGIDKIKLCLNPNFLNRSIIDNIKWHYDSKERNQLHSLAFNNNLILERARTYYFLIINQEFFNHNLPSPFNNILFQVWLALQCLAHEGIITSEVFYTGYLPCIHHITEIEFYFSLKPHYAAVKEERSFNSLEAAKEEEGLYQYNGTETFYSYNGNSERSSVCFYNKREKDYHDNHYSRDEIDSYHFPYRLEFRLRGNDVSDIALLNAPLNTVFTSFLPTLAFLHNKFIKNNMDINIPLRNKYNRILEKSDEVTSVRNRSNKWCKKEKIEKCNKRYF